MGRRFHRLRPHPRASPRSVELQHEDVLPKSVQAVVRFEGLHRLHA
ncbi:hypothetical protein AKJ09_10580 [Labilithrix luteola]|uniref:Uncharacterized protein n=1 Tax=Labilithrix luteola TaxID=1391654 RepID=A0A0K1QE31_9BACT|nr:hypothetical protein AKJ09_10580 [Labilithrix luteola]